MQRKSFLITEVLAILLGWLGAHRYYTGYIGLGVLQTLTLGGCGIWALIDIIFISLGKYKDAKGQELEDYNKNIGIAAISILVILTLCGNHLSKTVEKTIINNNSTEINNYYEGESKEVSFENAKCTVYKNGGYACVGELTKENEAEIERITAELK